MLRVRGRVGSLTSTGDSDENIEIVELSAEEAFAAIDSGEIRDCKTTVSLLLACRRGYL